MGNCNMGVEITLRPNCTYALRRHGAGHTTIALFHTLRYAISRTKASGANGKCGTDEKYTIRKPGAHSHQITCNIR
eukprot:2536073-Prymnesium_polylepis.2